MSGGDPTLEATYAAKKAELGAASSAILEVKTEWEKALKAEQDADDLASKAMDMGGQDISDVASKQEILNVARKAAKEAKRKYGAALEEEMKLHDEVVTELAKSRAAPYFRATRDSVEMNGPLGSGSISITPDSMTIKAPVSTKFTGAVTFQIDANGTIKIG
jgi:hypothetical protein